MLRALRARTRAAGSPADLWTVAGNPADALEITTVRAFYVGGQQTAVDEICCDHAPVLRLDFM